PAKSLTEEQKAIHLLDRTAFGPRPGDVERVRRMGLDKYLDEQLHPERITDVTAEEKLKGIESVKMTNEQLAASYPPPQVLREALKARGIELPNQQNQNQPPPMPPPPPPLAPGEQPPPNGMNADEMRARQRAQKAMRELGYKPQQQIVQELQQAKI